MAVAAAAPNAAGGGPPAAAPAAEGGGWIGGLQQAVRTLALLMLLSNLSKTFLGGSQSGSAVSSSSSAAAGDESGSGGGSVSSSLYGESHAKAGLYRGRLHPLWHEHTPMSLRVYLSAHEDFDHARDHPSALVWAEEGLTFDWAEGNARERRLNVSRASVLGMANANASSPASYFAHVLFTRTDFPFDPENPHIQTYRRVPLTVLKPRPKDKALRSLLDKNKDKSKSSDNTDTTAAAPKPATAAQQCSDDRDFGTDPSEPAAPAPTPTGGAESKPQGHEQGAMAAFWKPTLSLHLVHHFDAWPHARQLPPFIVEQMQIDPEEGWLWPIVYPSEFWLLKEHLIPLESSENASLPLTLSYAPIGFFKWQIQLQMDAAFEAQRQGGMAGEGEADTVKRMLIETNPILLAITFIVSCLHMLFDMLAVKNDVEFWRKARSMEGLSLRTLALNAFFHLVIFLYLLDNDTSWMVLLSSGLSLVVDVWKVHKGLVASFIWADPRTGRRYRIPRLQLRAVASYSRTKTQQYDEEATSHLMYIVAPLMAGYALYSLVHERHKGWYSWAVTSLTGFVYVFGFVMMTPQLYINYKLKSVSHLPWRTMVYKALNTFIDDLFAFVIKMPTMHRLSCFRDDIIFFIMLYQRWIYPVDRKRLGDMDDGEEGEGSEATAAEADTAAGAVGGGGNAGGVFLAPEQKEEAEDDDDEEEEGNEAAPLLASGGGGAAAAAVAALGGGGGSDDEEGEGEPKED